tara:strand:- start:612 stop:1049 length:438 start_codon:yes stop_codon:yes gene_type:complete
MARITVEDCIDKFPSRFELVLVASNRARKLYAGENPTLEIDNDKNTVIALREIAEETLSKDQLKNDLIQEYQTSTFTEDEDINEIEDNSDNAQSVIDDQATNEMHQDEEVAIKKDEIHDKQIEETSIETSQDTYDSSSHEDQGQD